MRIQLIKEVNELGKTFYYVTKEGLLVSGTLTFNFQEAVDSYNLVVANAKPSKEVLEEIEIDY